MRNDEQSSGTARKRIERFFSLSIGLSVLCTTGSAACVVWLEHGGPTIAGIIAFFLGMAGFVWPTMIGKFHADEEWGENSKRELAAFGAKCLLLLFLGGIAYVCISAGYRSVHKLTPFGCILGVVSFAIGLSAVRYFVYFASTPWHLLPKDRNYD